MRSPSAECPLMWSNSSAVSGPGLLRMSSRVPILPMSWSSPPSRRCSSRVAGVAELHGRLHGIAGHPGGVPARIGVLGFERMHEHLHAIDQRLLVEPVELPDPALEVGLVETVLEDEIALFQRLVEPGPHLFGNDRLGEIIQRADPQALDRRGYLGHTGEHDDGHLGIETERLPEEGDAIHVRHVDVGDAQRDFAVLRRYASASGPEPACATDRPCASIRRARVSRT